MRIYLAGESYDTMLLRAIKRGDLGEELAKHVVDLMGRHPYRLFSHYYVKEKRSEGEFPVLNDAYDSVIVDSGIFSFIIGARKEHAPKTFIEYRDYTRRYLDDLNDWGYRGLLVEMDVHHVLPMEDVFRLREEFESVRDRCMFVWHKPEGLDGLAKLARERAFIGIALTELRRLAGGNSSGGKGSIVYHMLNDLLKRVHLNQPPPRVHLLGCSTVPMMETNLAWSCDSTSWMSGLRYGHGWLYTEQGLRLAHIDSPIFAKWQAKCEQRFPEAMAICDKLWSEQAKKQVVCAMAFADYQKSLDTRIQWRGPEWKS